LETLIFKELVFKVLTETINWIFLCDLENCIVQLLVLVVKSVTLDCFVNELDIWCKISLKLSCNDTERIHYHNNKFRLSRLYLKNLQELMD